MAGPCRAFPGCAVGFKALADTVESSPSIDADPFRVKIAGADGFRDAAKAA